MEGGERGRGWREGWRVEGGERMEGGEGGGGGGRADPRGEADGLEALKDRLAGNGGIHAAEVEDRVVDGGGSLVTWLDDQAEP